MLKDMASGAPVCRARKSEIRCVCGVWTAAICAARNERGIGLPEGRKWSPQEWKDSGAWEQVEENLFASEFKEVLHQTKHQVSTPCEVKEHLTETLESIEFFANFWMKFTLLKTKSVYPLGN